MARHFARLKLALLASAFKRGRQQAIGLVVGVLVALPIAAGVALALVVGAGRAAGPSLLVLAFALLTLGWAVAPVLLFGTDETLDPARLQLLPLSRRQLLTGLTVASAVGVGPVATAIVLVSGFAYVDGPAGAVIAAAAVAVQLLVCLWAGRALSTALSSALRSRKGRDLATVAAMLVGLGFAGLGQIPNVFVNVLQPGSGAADELVAVLDDVAGVIAWTPLGWAGGAIAAAGQGRWLAAIASLVGLAALAVALAWGWQAALARSLTTPDTAAAPSGADQPLLPAPAGSRRPGRLGATVAKELRYISRVPQLRMGLVFLALLCVGLIVATAVVEPLDTRWTVYAPAAVGLMSALQAVNLFGHDRGAVWLLISVGGPYRTDLAGKSLGHIAASSALLIPVTIVVAALTGAWSHVVAGVVAVLALQLTAHGVGMVASVLAPSPMPQNTSNVWGSASGVGCATAMLQMLAMLIQAGLLAPILAGVGATALLAPAWLPLALALAAAYAVGVWLGGAQLAAARLDARAPELVAALSATAGR